MEVTGLEEVAQALDAGVDIIMLDNMETDEILKALRMIGPQA